jgi:peptide/nickel transport system substrate-binding protein
MRWAPISRRHWLAHAAALAAAAAPARTARAAGRPLRIVGPWEIAGLEPAVSGFFFTRMQVAETLVDADEHGRLIPGLASHWQAEDDGRHWRFVLRAGARFHDGTAVRPVDVAAALQRAHGKPGLLRLAPATAFEPVGDAVRVTLREPYALLPALLAHSSAMVLAPTSLNTHGAVTRIIGSGPYRVTELAPPQRFSVQATDRRQALQQASYFSAARAETRALMAESGEADMAFALDPASLQRLRLVPRLTVSQVTVPRSMILKVNCGHRWLADGRARQALSLSIHRAGIARGLLRDAELAASQLLPPTLAGWHQPDLPPLAFNPSAARALWASLGWQPGADGIFQRGGERLSLSLRTFPDRPELPLVAAALQEQLRQCGVACRVLIGNSGDIPLRHRDGSLELGLAARHYALTPDPLGTLVQDFSPEGGDWGAMNWSSPVLQQALQSLARGEGPASAWRRQAVQVLHESLPVIPVAWYRQTAAVTASLGDVPLDPLERSWRLSAMPRLGAS